MAEARVDTLLTGQNLVTFSSGVSDQEKNDILDCLNYTEMRADRKFDRQHAWKRWIERYQAGLFNSGFKLGGVLESNVIRIQHRRELPEVVRSSIQSTGSPHLGVQGRSALEAMLRSSQVQSFFEDWFSTGRAEAFQVVPCRKASNGQIEVMVCGLNMLVETATKAWLTAPRLTMEIHVNGGSYLYDKKAFEPYREKVQSTLERYSRLYFDSLMSVKPAMPST
ncbi:hypothetical protein [Pseudomonas petrae]|uniref:hypothetical protein n=1 Tax=Pseudomonas petrae TaxID=2912190 RepID=UPI001EF122F5|nr:hypothetical protein [Pseudomonas petrae]MCF7531891.1 hypothetical protein [Pseudomonas petrae]MCF7537454.1 hypothetical protein [Pseudomonas petrae]MCF7556789.1 hypothetical protein [Pseudomonas petrae]